MAWPQLCPYSSVFCWTKLNKPLYKNRLHEASRVSASLDDVSPWRLQSTVRPFGLWATRCSLLRQGKFEWIGPQQGNQLVRHTHCLKSYPRATVGKAGPSPIVYTFSVVIAFQPKVLHRSTWRLYIVLFTRKPAGEQDHQFGWMGPFFLHSNSNKISE
jgi:hypothetical protein